MDMDKTSKDILDKAAPEIESIRKNREEIYKISKQLPDEQGFLLMCLIDNTMDSLNKAWSKMI